MLTVIVFDIGLHRTIEHGDTLLECSHRADDVFTLFGFYQLNLSFIGKVGQKHEGFSESLCAKLKGWQNYISTSRLMEIHNKINIQSKVSLKLG